MNEAVFEDWPVRYSRLVKSLSATSGDTNLFQSGVFLCGMSACVDALINMDDMQPLLDAARNSRPGELAAMLMERVSRGVGGEVRLDWPEGPAWLREHLMFRYALGGTGPQAAWVLSKLGAQALTALEDRHEHMLRQIPPGVLLAQDGRVVTVADVRPSGKHVPEIFIFEFTAGQPIGDVVPVRSSRVIVRFSDRGVQHDRNFTELSKGLASTAAAGLLSGLNDEPIASMASASRQVFDLGRDWKKT